MHFSAGLRAFLFRGKDRESSMSRDKGKRQAKSVERDFPHVVEIAVPPNGLGGVLIAMYEFHSRHGLKPTRSWAPRIRWQFYSVVLCRSGVSGRVRE
jgi:hypothetical protein